MIFFIFTLLIVLFFIYSNILFYVLFFSLCISCFTIYHGIRATVVSLFTQAGEKHDPQIAQSFTDLESIRHRLFTRLGELPVILSKDPHRKIPRGRRPSYAQKISVRSSRVKAEHTTLERSRKKRVQKKKL
jgi:hypothetical protein